MRECVIEGCKKLATARGLCANHYQQWITRKKPLDEDGKPDLAAILAPAKRGPKSTASKQAPLPKPQPEPPAQAKEQHPLPTPPKLLPLEPELDGDFWRLVGEAEKLAKQLGKHCRCFISVQCKERNFHITFEEGRR